MADKKSRSGGRGQGGRRQKPPAGTAKSPSRPKSGQAAASGARPPGVADARAAVELLGRTPKHPGKGSGHGRGPRSPLERACKVLLEFLRRHCPDILPPEPLEPGKTTPPIPIAPRDTRTLVRLAARQAALEAAGLPVSDDVDRLPRWVLWQDGPDALLVEVGRIDVTVGDGVVTVDIPVVCDQVKREGELVRVDLVLGKPDRPTGLLAAATEPRGPRVVVRRWGDALTALAWQAVLDSIGGVAAAAGVDRDGAGLIPTAMTVSARGIAVLAQARHDLDRVRPGRVVSTPSRRGMIRP